MLTPLPFQRRFLRHAFAPGIDTAALSLPRGNGKSTLAAEVLRRCLTPGHPWNVEGLEYALVAASIENSRAVFGPLRDWADEVGGFRVIDSVTRVGITHVASRTRLRVLSSNPKTAQGIVRTGLLVGDEPGAYQTRAGEALADSILTAQGKPDSRLRVLWIGTLAPATGGWWHDMIRDGSGGRVHVTAFQGDPETWDQWPTIRKANPLMSKFADSRRVLLEERDAARADTRLKARFLSYRLNVPTPDESTVLLTVPEWLRVLAREVPGRQGQPVVGIDLGAGRAWSAAVAIWPGGRVEALAVAPGLPDIGAQERRDRVPSGTYRALVDAGVLILAEGREVQTPGQLVEAIRSRWGAPVQVVCDRLQVPTLRADFRGAGLPVNVIVRVGRWSEANEDIHSLRRHAKDGPLAVEAESGKLLTASLAVAMVKPDTSGNVRMVKRDGFNNTGRDDVAVALVLAAGAHQRRPAGPRWRYRGMVA